MVSRGSVLAYLLSPPHPPSMGRVIGDLTPRWVLGFSFLSVSGPWDLGLVVFCLDSLR